MAEVYIDKFNEKTEEFLSELTTNFPDIKQFATFKLGFAFMKNFSKTEPQVIFNQYVYKEYKDYILNQDENFFLTSKLNIANSNKEDHWEDFIDNIRGIWKNLDSSSKDAIWKYLKVLVVLNEKCIQNT